MSFLDPLPIDAVLPALSEALAAHATVLLSAPPGAGKTTRVPLALLDAEWAADQRIIMLEPRRLAARAAAGYMARSLGEPVGQRVGFRTRLETRVSKASRIEVVTEGILTRMIQSDPSLDGIACLIFDEFHERSLNADLGLALAREVQQALRPELKLLIMSATLAVEALQRRLDQPPLIQSLGRSYPVALHYRPGPRERRLEDHVARIIREALDDEPGSVLVFLPGVGEIRRVAERLSAVLPEDVRLCPLYGDLPAAEQDAAIAPAPDGSRKLVLATAIAESSLTIEGVRVVIDAGLERRARFDANAGMSRLVTGRVSRASADQRAGRAGRTQPGACYRLWRDSEQAQLAPHSAAEILHADLAGTVLELAQWGVQDPAALLWLDPPPPAHWQQAVELLQWLDALDDKARISAHGQALLGHGLHPRLAHLLERAKALGQTRLAAELAALLSDRDPLPPGSGADLSRRIQALHRGGGGRLGQARQLAARLARGADADSGSVSIGGLLALAFPDRIGQARGPRGRYRLSNGRGAFLPEDDSLAGSPWLVAAELDGQAREARIFLAAPVDLAELETLLAGHIRDHDDADWDDQRGTVLARRQRRLGSLVLAEQALPKPTPEVIEAGLLDAVRRKGLQALSWTEAARQWQARVMLLQRLFPEQWPAVDDASLEASLDQWLRPWLSGLSRWREVEALDLEQVLAGRLDHAQRQDLARLAPTALTIPSGRKAGIDYRAEGGPVLAAKLQSLFGWQQTPRLADGRVPLVLHLLSPAGRPLAVTADLGSFWAQVYPDVRKTTRGRYPKHPWPEDPFTATASDGVKRRPPR